MNTTRTRYETRDGRPAEILKTDLKGNFPIVAVIPLDADTQTVVKYRADGKISPAGVDSDLDLIKVIDLLGTFLWVDEDGIHTTTNAEEASLMRQNGHDVHFIPLDGSLLWDGHIETQEAEDDRDERGPREQPAEPEQDDGFCDDEDCICRAEADIDVLLAGLGLTDIAGACPIFITALEPSAVVRAV